MEIYDFTYDGISLRDMGYMICQFDSGGVQTVTNGSLITFHTTPVMNGASHALLSAGYEECLQATFQICKMPSMHDDLEISLEDLRILMKWLNRKECHKLTLCEIDNELGYSNLYFEASFNISKIEFGARICGLELTMHTNRPYALQKPRTITIKTTKNNETKSFTSVSDEEGFIYPYMEIELASSGNLTIYNALEDRTMRIANCVAGEKITLDYPVIQSSLASHRIQDDFNWNFFRIAATCRNAKNNLTVSIPCQIKMTYSPIYKLAI